MQYQININIAVDVVKALSDKSLKGNIYLMDDSSFNSLNQGTGELCTFCMPGQALRWVVYPIDLQTPVVIKHISFIAHEGNPERNDSGRVKNNLSEDDPDLKTWTGILPAMKSGHKYRYRLELQMGNGKNSIISIDSPSLAYIRLNQFEEENKQDQKGTNHE